MYGYVRPLKGELKVSEYERYRGVYCGLCHRLKQRYGILARFLVSYDCTFLAMLLSEGDCPEKAVKCPYHPLKKGLSCPCGDGATDAAADRTVILAYWKLRDGAADSGFLKRLLYKALCLIYHPAYRKAAGLAPAVADATKRLLGQLSSLEAEGCQSPDRAADCFASLLREAGAVPEEPKNRIIGELLYHLGRIIYMLDAVDDLPEDMKDGCYNPLIYRYGVTDKLSPEDEEELRRSLQLSHNALSSAFALLKETVYTPILSNIIYLGLPSVTAAVFSGEWRKKHNDRSKP